MRSNAAHWRMCFARPLRRSLSALAAIGLLFFPGYVFAHPMGNFSISHYSGISIGRDYLEVRYLIDMAEIPTFQEMQQFGLTARRDEPRLPAYLSAKAAAFAQDLHVTINGRAVPLGVVSEDVIFPTGAGNLPTMKFGFVYRAQIANRLLGCALPTRLRGRQFPGPCRLERNRGRHRAGNIID